MKSILQSIPKTPWIYQFLDKNNKIIYIWKSVNLFSRVNSYFNGQNKLSFAKKKMVDQVKDIKTIIVNNETESLILETTLIKKHLPKYNILMKDGKNHIYIKITEEEIPKIIKTRFKTNSWIYFWPYISTNYVNNILKIIKKLFWYRSCNLRFNIQKHTSPHPSSLKEKEYITLDNLGNIKIPCMDYYIKRCAWPCLLKQKEINEYKKSIEDIKRFLKWDFKEIEKSLELKMKNYAKELKFEQALKIKNDLESIKILDVKQIVREVVVWDYDVVHSCEKFDKFYIWLITIRDSKITWYYNYEIENKLEEEKSDVFLGFIERKIGEYLDEWEKIPTFLLPFELDTNNSLLASPFIRDRNIFEVPKIWNKLELLQLCYKNIYEFAMKKHLASLSTKGFTKQTMKNLLHVLWYDRINKELLFECNDISHLSWTHTVASRSIILNWKSDTSKYKKFRIKNLEVWKIDDFNSMREIMDRRLLEIEKTWLIPDLIIIDWWKGQLSSVVEIIEKSPLELQVVWIAKREEELFLPWESEAIILKKDSLELRMVQKIRDEAHRFAITFNRDSRNKAMKKNILESLPWIWPKTRKKILSVFWSVEWLKDAKKDELNKVLNNNVIEILGNHWLIND